MISFLNYLIEDQKKTLHAFDMDEVLVHHDPKKLKVHVVDHKGNRVESLTNQEYNNHKLKPGHSYDYSDFKSSKVFKSSAHPIHKMIRKMQHIQQNKQNVNIVTARSDMDNKEHFKHTLSHHGIDADAVHVHRAGNTGLSPAKAKHKVIGDLIKKHGYQKVHLYDDSQENLNHFKKLKQDHPNVEFHAHHVEHDPKTGHVKVTTTTA